jgi:beta-phosphoglucomutase
MIKAFLFDLNGTMIDDMQYHIIAWHNILNENGASISIEKTKQNCYGKNEELIERIFPNQFTDVQKAKISFAKEAAYQKAYKPHLKLIDGLDDFLFECKKLNIKMAIGSAAIMSNINFVIDGLNIRHYFDAIISADEVKISKPNAETYLSCAAALGCQPNECIVFEDVPKGIESAANAGMQAIVITGLHKKNEFYSYNNVLKFMENYTHLNAIDLISN